MNNSYQDLKAWQTAMSLARNIYRATESFPEHELYGLTNQLRRASVSVPSNIAEGKGRRSDKEFLNFLHHARGSLLEIETQVILANQLHYLADPVSKDLLSEAAEVGRILNGLINAFRSKSASTGRS